MASYSNHSRAGAGSCYVIVQISCGYCSYEAFIDMVASTQRVHLQPERAGKVEKEAAAPDSDISNSGENHVVQKPRRVILTGHFCYSLFQFGAFQLCVCIQSHTQSPCSPIPGPHAVPYPVPMQSHTQSPCSPIPSPHTQSPCSPIPSPPCSPIPSPPHAVPYPVPMQSHTWYPCSPIPLYTISYSCHCGGFNSETVLIAVMAYCVGQCIAIRTLLALQLMLTPGHWALRHASRAALHSSPQNSSQPRTPDIS